MIALDLVSHSCIYSLLEEIHSTFSEEERRPFIEIKAMISSAVTRGDILIADNNTVPKCFAWAAPVDFSFTKGRALLVKIMHVTELERGAGLGGQMYEALKHLAKTKECDSLIFASFNGVMDGFLTAKGAVAYEALWKGELNE